MKRDKQDSPGSINIIFIMSLACCLGGVLISALAAHLSMPVIAWTALYVSLAGFAIQFLLLVLVVGAEISQLLRVRASNRPGVKPV